jgi:starvation-inducible DNA-binding protein
MPKLEKTLNHSLSHALGLKLQAKQAHWNIRGSNFMMWHELLDKIAATADEIADSIAERNVQLGNTALGLSQHVAQSTDVSDTHDIAKHVKAVLAAMQLLKLSLQDVIDAAEKSQDDVTTDLATSNRADLDKLIWFVSAHGL